MHSRCGTQGARPECSNDEPGRGSFGNPMCHWPSLNQMKRIYSRPSVIVQSPFTRRSRLLLGNDVILSAVQTLKKTIGRIEDPVK